MDVSDPSAPFELGAIDPDQYLTQIVDAEVGDRYVYAVDESLYYLHVFEFGPEYDSTIDIAIDIMPGSDSNPINLSLEGSVPIAILGSDSFDVAEVDVTTIVFGPIGAPFSHSHGPHYDDMNNDGFTDLIAHFHVDETGIDFGDRTACLTGQKVDGIAFKGCDGVRTVPDMDGDLLLDVEEESIGTHSLKRDTDGDGFDDGEEVLEMGTDPLDPLDPEPDPVPEPASWLMLVAGMAFLGLLYRQRARRQIEPS
jgi:hypothetical protein